MTTCTLGELCVGRTGIQTGPFGSQLHKEDYAVVGTPIITVEHLGENRITRQNLPLVSDQDVARLSRYQLEQGDIVFSRVGSVDRRALVRGEESGWLFSGRCLRVRPNREHVDPEFLSYYLGLPTFKDYIRGVAVGATMPSINTKILSDAPVTLPGGVAVQRLIGRLLGRLDDKIELNRRMNETLEAMAQAIFRDWFVDFGPVRRKLEGATDPVAIMGGLLSDPARAAELAGLFPGEFGDDELPLGWKAGDLGDLATTAGESVDPTQLTEDTPYIGLEHMPRRSITLDNWDYAGKVSSQKSRFSSGQVLFGKLRPYFHKVGIAPVDGVCSTDIVVLDSQADYDRGLIACCASSDAFVAFTDLTSSGTKMPRTSWSHMKTYDLAIADAPVRRAFSGLVGPMHQKVVSSVAENRTLAETRDYLLPRLMSGEVRLSDAALEIAA